jgi:hypothetical protein
MNVRKPVGVVSALLLMAVPFQALSECSLTETSTEEVLPGIVVSWSSSYHCAEADTFDTFELTVTVTNDVTSTEAVALSEIQLIRTTPPGFGRQHHQRRWSAIRDPDARDDRLLHGAWLVRAGGDG